jgi:hypothetical protein
VDQFFGPKTSDRKRNCWQILLDPLDFSPPELRVNSHSDPLWLGFFLGMA